MANILLVEDDEGNARLATLHLERAGHCVTWVSEGLHAVALIEESYGTHCDLVLLDGRLPDIDGIQLSRTLRATRRWSLRPILAITGRASDEECAEMLAAGVNAVLIKPYRGSDLLRVLADHLMAQNPEEEAGAEPSRSHACP